MTGRRPSTPLLIAEGLEVRITIGEENGQCHGYAPWLCVSAGIFSASPPIVPETPARLRQLADECEAALAEYARRRGQ